MKAIGPPMIVTRAERNVLLELAGAPAYQRLAERFYAMGIDAYRIAQSLLRPDAEFQPIDGVTGMIILDQERRLSRDAVPAQFVQGETRVLADPASQ